MTIFKKLILSLAIAPLAIPVAYANVGSGSVGGAGKATFKEFTIKEELVVPAVLEERRVIKQQAMGPLTQVNPTKPSINEEALPYQGLPDHDECTQNRIRYNIICSERQDP